MYRHLTKEERAVVEEVNDVIMACIGEIKPRESRFLVGNEPSFIALTEGWGVTSYAPTKLHGPVEKAHLILEFARGDIENKKRNIGYSKRAIEELTQKGMPKGKGEKQYLAEVTSRLSAQEADLAKAEAELQNVPSFTTRLVNCILEEVERERANLKAKLLENTAQASYAQCMAAVADNCASLGLKPTEDAKKVPSVAAVAEARAKLEARLLEVNAVDAAVRKLSQEEAQEEAQEGAHASKRARR